MSGVAVPALISISLVMRVLFCFLMEAVTPNSAGTMGGIVAEIRVLAPMKLSTWGVCASRSLPPIRIMRFTMSRAASGEAKASLS